MISRCDVKTGAFDRRNKRSLQSQRPETQRRDEPADTVLAETAAAKRVEPKEAASEAPPKSFFFDLCFDRPSFGGMVVAPTRQASVLCQVARRAFGRQGICEALAFHRIEEMRSGKKVKRNVTPVPGDDAGCAAADLNDICVGH
ncbi:hypothetical protein MPC4_130065 [Methylocella tundrae]|uniref:Uncharacterized protein n=1 Tax=Methylocella tundrae TaxID=227605 RepID=A0A8B6M2M9_METTU|nr:hypothetical protein MPC1_3720002 [Methylocella tundrae]VTZ49044.1 hypothetical protein MPC4_130065 [Methylocella tundrae]